MTKKEKEIILKAIEDAYYRSYKDEESLLLDVRASTLFALALDLGIDGQLVLHSKNLGKVAALGM